MTRAKVQSPAATAVKTPKRCTCSSSNSSGSRPVIRCSDASGAGVRRRGSRMFLSDTGLRLLHLTAPFQFLEIDLNRLVRPQQIGEYFIARPCWPVDRAAAPQIRPERLPNGCRQDAFQVLERRTLQVLVVGVKAPKRNLKRLARQHEGQQRE